jgi:hypothetical protein
MKRHKDTYYAIIFVLVLLASFFGLFWWATGPAIESAFDTRGRTIWYNTDGIGNFNLPSHIRGWVEEWDYTGPPGGDCDDYALQMIKDAWSDNFTMGFVLSPGKPAHMLVCAIWDNNIYFIEPQAKRVNRIFMNSYWILDK